MARLPINNTITINISIIIIIARKIIIITVIIMTTNDLIWLCGCGWGCMWMLTEDYPIFHELLSFVHMQTSIILLV